MNIDLEKTANDILVRLFRDIMNIEEQALITEGYKNITNNDMHILEAIGIGEPKSMTAVAESMSVTTGTLTIAINSLVQKEYVKRSRSNIDKRVVLISLSDKGLGAYNHHKKFHDNMIQSMIARLNEEEQRILHGALINLARYFDSFSKEA